VRAVLPSMRERGSGTTAVAGPEPPFRLPLGSDAVEALSAAYTSTQTELTTWESLSRSADFPS